MIKVKESNIENLFKRLEKNWFLDLIFFYFLLEGFLKIFY